MHGSSFAGSNRAFTLTFKPYELSLAPHHVHATRLRPSNKVIRTEARIGQRNGATTSRNSFLPQQLQQQQATAANLKTQWDQITSTALYKYFLWRKDAFSDLQAITLLVVGLILTSVVCKVLFLGQSGVAAWDEFYAAAVTTFGEAWPPTTAPIITQVSSIGLYLSGLCVFAVLLALVEQSVLQVYETRVELGSPVQETGHILVLCWCRSQTDVSKLEVILKQLCAAYSADGGRTLVVLSQRRKTEMEDVFMAAIPPQQRGGSRFVFRQGNPLTADDLKRVAADEASAILVLADSAACPDASDSQVLRVLVLLDECEAAARQEGRKRPTPGHVVAEVLCNDAMPLLRFMPTKAVLPLPSHRVNACRLARLVTRPVVSHLTDQLWDFENSCAIYMHTFPQLAGHNIADVSMRFADGIVLGVLEGSTGFVLVNPPPEYTLNADEQLILLRPTNMTQSDVKPLPAPVSAPIGSYSPETAAAAWRASQQSLNMPMVISCGCDTDILDAPPNVMTEVENSMLDDLGVDQQLRLREAEIHQQRSDGSRSPGGTQQQRNGSSRDQQQLRSPADSLNSSAANSKDAAGHSAADGTSSNGSSSNGTAAAKSSIAAALRSLPESGYAVSSWESDGDLPMQTHEVMDLLNGTRPGYNTCRMFSLAESSVQLSRNTPLNLLVLGWGDTAFMTQLLLALATGPTALPAGSHVTFANSHTAEGTLQLAVESAGPPELLSNVKVDHVQLNPLVRGQLGKLDLQTANAAIVVCDTSWRHQSMMQALHFTHPAAAAVADSHAAVYSSGSPGSSMSNEGLSTAPAANPSAGHLSSHGHGGYGGSAAASAGVYGPAATGFGDADVLQLDALLLRVQLNLRSMLQEIGREKEVNIITEKVGTEQETRFEDKSKLPLGVPVNLSSYTACIMSQLAFCPMMILPRTLGAQIDPLIVDADLYTTVGDKVSFWQLMKRAQLLGHVLLGYYLLPVTASDPIEAVICPPGDGRHERRVWNTGDNRLKFIVLQDAADARARDSSSAIASAAAAQGEQLEEEKKLELWELMAGAGSLQQKQGVLQRAADTTATYYPVDGGWQWWMH